MIVTSEWLNAQQEENIVILDARHDLVDLEFGRREYNKDHIPGALFIDMATELADLSLEGGGRYPMPSPQKMADMFAKKGINEDSRVVVYDDNNGGMAAGRVWWMLHYLGKNQVALLEGGISAWKEKGFPTTNEVKPRTPIQFTPTIRNNERIEAEEVYKKLADDNVVLIDARTFDRYSGQSETLDAKAGHIPGALSYFWKEILADNKKWKNNEELGVHFNAINKESEVIVYCGSGISACPNVMALKKAGYSNVKLYPGSWSDWITHDQYPIE
ncbi:thiosulfate/3-mercaptopyruvate sulfurtransferase [Alkalihalobacillus xiaoxiensis]|uniref:Thiosulfate/3-mercaptopyruvate sulfurtransferase n=1 Tax=Shouchella xiaoxiensis TaxID=766895 RepID=A0ABS2ST66_9BACI|nr:sulfurtransferase [Shouchella xiaoxiensis]MBM7838679.1 thiosulfate/3-mercaptopyruvate sulfurtransferase [Shouchella xiaoxiensis]